MSTELVTQIQRNELHKILIASDFYWDVAFPMALESGHGMWINMEELDKNLDEYNKKRPSPKITLSDVYKTAITICDITRKGTIFPENRQAALTIREQLEEHLGSKESPLLSQP
ncbi:hypothetical protein A2630_01895 [Candidatus Woesebacteria bacterium RIFCSPHIGHO2_01_FULL_44_10]|uniref:Uncharacterized protein n=1 Tax=Candidatus Woesebacteria bacterium RIFCSPLOWO2_01_FULL_44_14 TaxID=1802525 RepID=A0A1F8C0S4_9BACT|nr:MAG: hypothetical protein A2630_01895 [Candidatus Woesebacteria bacterium RIFCSPHIGHO2_01_FULL_44_10]OGM53993.1 MAG: hypothetical protein A3F62_00290 [Candidatus Woesebacteria bacterium RIFCSPHIGHO2_12_FULL_44_11]OGM69961.1 MAG: hypothetical protein A2975_05130 [Candidatus Woesebacteria bacterium RIFCSPLOWO2_01_FULL_44_14]